MSGFQDTFGRNNQDKELQYDDAASYFFFAAILSIIVLPLAWNIVSHLLQKPGFDNKKVKCKWREELNLNEFNQRKYSKMLYWKIILLVFLSYLLLVCAYKGSFIKDLKSFDPYEILEITDGATDKEIKKAYKILAKKYHPDFNPGDPEANSKFIIVNKAYRCLTDPEVMEKCKQFGNPDGASSYQVAIALPSALLSKKNRPLVLAMFFLVVIVFLPIGVWIWYSENEKLDDFGVNKQSMMQAAGFMRNENIRTQDVMEMVSASLEFLPIRACKLGQSNALKKIQDSELMPLISKDKNPYLKVMYLIHAYMGRAKIPAELEDDVKLIHRKSLSEFSLELTIKQHKFFAEMKPLTYNSFMNVLNFCQLYYQGLKPTMSPLYQLPHVDESIVTKATKKLKGNPSFGEILSNSELTEKLLSCFENEQHRESCKSYIGKLPQIEFKVETFVNEEGRRNPEIRVGDVFEIEVSVTDRSIPEDQPAHYMQSHTFPYLKYVNWHVFLLGYNQKKLTVIGDFKMMKGDKFKVSETFQQRLTQEGTVSLRFLLKPDCYIGYEVEKTVTFEILPPVEAKIYIHPEDEEAIKRPNLYAQLLAQLNQNDSDEELEDDGEAEKPTTGEQQSADEANPDANKVKTE